MHCLGGFHGHFCCFFGVFVCEGSGLVLVVLSTIIVEYSEKMSHEESVCAIGESVLRKGAE